MTEVIVTGGLGFLGLQFAKRILRGGVAWSPLTKQASKLETLTLVDLRFPEAPLPEEVTSDPRVRVRTGDLAAPGIATELIESPDVAVVHLASMVSGDSEAQPDEAWLANVTAQHSLIHALREAAPGARFLFTSSTAALGDVGDGAADPDDATKLLPQNTYGFHKAVSELMLNDASRRGWVDGRALRLPVVVVRPGAPNAALTGAWSSVVREPLAGRDYALPLPRDLAMPVASYQVVAEALETLLVDVDGGALGADRTLMLPALSLSNGELADAAARLAERRGLGQIGAVTEEVDAHAAAVVGGMARRVVSDRAVALGLPRDESADAIVEGYAADYL